MRTKIPDKMPCYTPLKGYKDIATGGLTFNKTGTAQTLEVACGQCLGCRSDNSLMWAVRIVHESSLYSDKYGNCFITLTYRDLTEANEKQFRNGHYIPEDYSLQPSHVSKFIRRLRKTLPQKIKYFYCGEYGDENQRPHYHVCLFNHSFNDQQLFEDDEGFHTYTSPSLEKLWPYGFSTVAELNYSTAAYTARYSLKKITGKRADDHYLRCNEHGEAYWLLPEYIRMSTGNTKGKHQGLGAEFYEKYKTDFFPSDESPVPGHGIVQKVPRYYQTILASADPGTLELVRELRQEFIKAHRAEFTEERLRDKYHCALVRNQRRKRIL